MPRDIGDIGFPIELHPRDQDTAWVFPMDGDGGSSWSRQSNGMPDRAWFTVKRQAMTTDADDPVGVYFGTTSGEVWASADEGESWTCLTVHLPEIYSVEILS